MNKLRRWGQVLLIVCMVLMILYFITRNFFLQKAFNHIAKKLKGEYQTEISLTELRFKGFAGIEIKNLAIVTEQQDTLLIVDSMYVRPDLFRLLIGKIRLKEARVKNASLFLVCRDSSCNYQAFLQRKRNETEQISPERNYAALLSSIMNKAFDIVPQEADFKNINVRYTNEDKEDKINFPSFVSSDQHVEGSLINLADSSQWNLAGSFSQRNRTFDFKIYPEDSKKSNVPLLQSLVKANCRFDSLHCVLSEYSHSRGRVELSGNVSVDHFFLQHPKISDEPVGIDHADFSFNIHVGKNYFGLDSSSFVQLNKMVVRPVFEYLNDESKKYELKVSIDQLPANDFFTSLPSGMFDEVEGVEADGTLQYSLCFKLDSSQPDSLVFNSTMKKEKFRLKNGGRENLLKMNGEFMYSVYENDKFVRSFMVGSSNPGFTPIEQVSPYFKNAVMTSEDGSFFFHNGFNEDAFRKSIAANYKAGKFVRGGSTISMQLIKNVFLTRHKTIARKVEEALMVWLIESNRLCSKERMFEVYLNIIELGPGIYGIGEASKFYFNKRPGELNLAESVFLASLLPRPKWFKYSFDEQGNLKPYFADYYRVVANFLLKKDLISQVEYDQLRPHVELKGLAKNFVVITDSIPKTEEEPGEQ